MNERFLSRGKRKDNGDWVEGYLYITHNGEYEISRYDDELDTERLTYIVIPETVARCTGLKDKNGKWIFEGDVLKQKTTKEFAKFNSFKWELYGIVTFGNYDYNEGDAGHCSVGWYIAPLKSIAIYPKDYLIGDIQPGINQEDILKSIYPMEVIGNIHDNPELLEVER